MNTEHEAVNVKYDKVKELFLAVHELSPAEQAAFLDRACVDNPALRAEVEALVALREPDPTAPATEPPGPGPGVHPKKIGSYRVIRQLGAGGMGVVYLGFREDDQFRHPVAIKVLKRGMDTEEILRRFELERHLMSGLNHPGIARLYDAGQTEDGLPFFTMEYVQGQPIDEYCDTHRLRISERLDLFRQVCAAVHYAHQNLVVHRDLKPSHILVNRDGVTKLLDFGIAKFINPEMGGPVTVPTAPDLVIMTPEYASPEQVRGLPITTASDIYTLGVILYQLVSGHRPYQITSRARADVAQVVCGSEPDKPSTAVMRIEKLGGDSEHATAITPEQVSQVREGTPDRLRRRLAGDVDNIVLMAMRKESQRRHQSAEQFGEDIQRHLNNLPIRARHDSASYRCAKFVRRHPSGVAAALIMGVMLVGWGLTSGKLLADEVTHRERITSERNRAEHMLDDVLSFAHTMIFELPDQIDHLDGSIPARQLLITTSLECLDGLSDQIEDDIELKRELASAYDRIGDLRGGIRNPSLGDLAGAEESYTAGLQLRRELQAALPNDRQLQARLSVSHMHLGDVRRESGDMDGALQAYREHLTLAESAAQAPEHQRILMMALNNVGSILYRQGDTAGARQHYSRSLDMRELRALEHPEDENALRDLAGGCLRMAELLKAIGDDRGALLKCERALVIRRRLVEMDSTNGRHRRDLAWTHYFIADLLLRLDRVGETHVHASACYAIFEQRVAANPLSVRARRDLAEGYHIMGRVRAAFGDANAALEQFRSFQQTIAPLAVREPGNVGYQAILADSHERIGETLLQQADPTGALSSYRQAIDIVRPLAGGADADIRRREQLARLLAGLAGPLIQADMLLEAEDTLRSARTLYDAIFARQPHHADTRYGLASTLNDLSFVLRERGYLDKATDLAERALALLEQARPNPRIASLRQSIEAGLNGAGNP